MSKTKDSISAVAMQRELLNTASDIANVLTTAKVSPCFLPHIFNMETSEHGIENTIRAILLKHEAIFPAQIGSTEFRKIAIATSLFTSDIIKEVEEMFSAGNSRYSYKTIHQYLSIFMTRNGTVGKIKLFNNEDSTRECFKPRVKWFLIQSQ